MLSSLLVLLALMTTGAGAAPVKKLPPPPSLRSPPPPVPTPSQTSVALALQGKLQYRTTRPAGTWLLTGVVVNKVTTNYQLPGQPIDGTTGMPIPPGRTISLTCILSGPKSTVCTSVAAAKVTVAAAPVQSTNLTLSVLVMVVSLTDSASCASRPGANVTDVRNAFLEPDGYADFFGNCSYGRMVFNRQALTVVSTAVSCSLPIMRCAEDAIASAAQQQATASGIKIGSYARFLYVLPVDFAVTCGWVGLAELPGAQSWFTADSQGIFSKGTVMQEMLHNVGLYHGWQDGVEYNDESTAMGYGDSCPSAPELMRLGWAFPLVELNSSSFPVATFRTFTLPATYLGPTGVMIKIRLDWLDFYTKNVYLALRVKAAGDISLLDKFNGKISIHEVNKDIDNDFTAPGDPRVSIIGVVGANSPSSYFNYKLYLLTGAFNPVTSSMSVKICRFVDGPNECVDMPPPPPPPPPSPPPPPPPTQSAPSVLLNQPFPPSPEDREARPPPPGSSSPPPSPDDSLTVRPPPKDRSPPRTPSPLRTDRSPPRTPSPLRTDRSPPRTPSPRRSNDD
ncbi:hypothetical protein VOLCADRAFT_89474 [Volvox carteri f. nagariensis]|uniref:Peptidase M11 gametolysin domain-containing protein n=1 Tax=Volvox carteri f. nagariensis TaxID=3068 RepID=D8TRX6_VOLCA|nr:uncharacterized protein VOLCADRAFT_89474 [Volvox carteri f. nagariensis]EFJ49723.1 hypothetical protein VOLCADRAFT_89474 [Volvox carteri f. nagariensis]|eukprot:XP_002949230.1 hypothetical protein VOLCADRAFT_89474 [Volvox carteri f. nagariensis]